MKTKIYLLSIVNLLFINCGGGPDLPPFVYADNSRIIIEGVLQNADGVAIQNQLVELQTSRYNDILVNSTFSDAQGKFYLSAPKANYDYFLVFKDKNIISMQQYTFLLKENTANLPLFLGIIQRLNKNYYDFKIIKITSI